MKFFLQSANLNEIRQAAEMNLLDGVVLCRGDALLHRADYLERLGEIAGVVDGPVSAEVISADRRRIVNEAESLCGVAPNVIPRLPTVTPGVKACKDLTGRGRRVHMTLCYQPAQALAAARAGAAMISLHLTWSGSDGEESTRLIRRARRVHDASGYKAELLACGVDTAERLFDVAAAGADAVAVTFPILEQMLTHPLTDAALRQMLERWHEPSPLPRISA